ncbi:aminotransferase class I/II-fold pyridoxal phosphate-dependent enzyme [Tumebacillus sp. DT12]|uniref:Aminotransferase class I/II-fold pyridoxal phosphate-dependent enzyme n=1 Tax=Tumebacillus lacus TaxID=2995335 RepID=A0ABT3X4U7_9BACL|nr:aminotransferase class I/II-fold pyridoxal phosphate-dependent enzyme [Tumebacillus lacus]MCX7571925.1 aminotransferase class I/II-fold pyridoxal phosphate-dependent enzyme [Tumebacillus lacus]
MFSGKIPILHAILSHSRKVRAAYHVPGHKMGRGLPGEIGAMLGAAGRLDLTEIPGLDDLHAPEGAILQAQRLAAEAFGAEETWFLVNGSTAGNLAMIMAAVKPGQQILVPRNLHKSVLNGLILAQAQPVFYNPDLDARYGIASGVDPETIREAVREHPEAKAVFVVSPTYHGICSDLAAIAQIAHEAGMLLLVDEAHGAHFAFHEDLPPTAMESGADLAVQSTHKTLGALTQSSMLHAQGERVDRVRLRKRLQLVQSTSPSYLLLASLDAARHQMATEGRHRFGKAMQALRDGVDRVRRELPDLELLTDAGKYRVDPLKWTIRVDRLGISGVQAYELLHERELVTLELADPRNVLAVFTYADTPLQVNRLVDALGRLASEGKGQNASDKVHANEQTGHAEQVLPFAREPFLLPPTPVMAVLPYEAFERESEPVALAEAAGRVAAETVIPYPPGIPVLVPGEVWTDEMVKYVQQLREAGVRFQGVEDTALRTVHVLT